jgi:hypothetical protein
MNKIPKFDRKELVHAGAVPYFMGGTIPLYTYPVTMKEGVRALCGRKPIWEITGVEVNYFCPRVNPENIARAMVIDAEGTVMDSGGGKDMFGVEWEFIPTVGGSMVRPGKPLLENANEWYDKIKFPDISLWDWDGAKKKNNGFLPKDKYNGTFILNGWFERLISFMDFAGAAEAIYDEDQRPAVIELFDKLSDLYIDLMGRYLDCFEGIDEFFIHDDWGSQRAPFFSPALADEVIVPAMKKVTDWIHSRGLFAQLHSCGNLIMQIPSFIAAGWDSWCGQPMNDTHKIYELYGDKILIGIYPDEFPEDATEEEQRAAARAFADKFCSPEKPSLVSMYGSRALTPAFREELYIASREKYYTE